MIKGLLITTLFISCLKAIDWSSLDSLVTKYVDSAAFPGASLRVANKTHLIYAKQYGKVKREIGPFGSPSYTNQTIIDIASLTKVTGTLAVIMKIVDAGIISIDDKVGKYITEFNNNGKQAITIQNLLLHNSGLLPDYVGPPANKSTIMDFIYNCKLQSPIGTKFVYSDLNFILLGQISERVLKQKLDALVKQLHLDMGIFNTGYLPDKSNLYKIAPTEYSKSREKLIWGEVHDPTAYTFGGVAGHAGIFSVATDLVSYMQVHLNKGVTSSGKRIYKEETVDKFYTRVDGLPYNNRRALGWDTVPIQQHPPCGHKFSLNSFGHTGYTGTMMWADRDKELIIVFLTNRVHPTSLSLQILAARTDVCDKIVDLLQSSN